MVIFHSFLYVYQRVNLHFPMVFLWFSHFPMVFLCFSNQLCRMIILPRYDQNWCDVRDDDSDGDDQDLWLSASLDSPDDGSGSSSELLVVEVIQIASKCHVFGEQMSLTHSWKKHNNLDKATWLWINTYENSIFSGMNIHKSQLFWCELQGYKVLTHCHMWNSMDWFKGKSTGNHGFLPSNLMGFPVNFPIIQFCEKCYPLVN